ncbi:MAG: nuclear transport factor 2 family protein [Pyrinomonadaceae bacterium]|nr:nuclear transport factor 2 family protein [Sphingobacteriaceae bacterium]
MKTIKTFTAAVLLILSTGAFAADEANNQKLQMDYTIKTYIDAISNGKVKGISEVFDNEVRSTLTRGEKIINSGRADILGALKTNENMVQNCSTSYSIVEMNTSQSIVKVIMKYEGFSRVNYLTMSNTSKGWKITNIASTFI